MKDNADSWGNQCRANRKRCSIVPGCILSSGHLESCQPGYQRGDYVKVEFGGEHGSICEWMWVSVDRCDHERQLVFGVLDSEPLNHYAGRLSQGTQVAVGYSRVREFKRSVEFRG